MNKARWLCLTISVAVVGALNAGPVAAQEEARLPCHDEEGNLVFNELKQWIKAPERKIGNLGATDLGEYPTWSGVEPTQSVRDGAGGATFYNRHHSSTLGSFEGTFTGCMDNAAWDLYLLSPIAPIGGNVKTHFEMYIDDTFVVLGGNPNGADTGADVDAPAQGVPGLYKLQFAFTGLYQAMNGSPGEFQPLEGEHSIELTLFTEQDNDAQGMLVYDAIEWPSRTSHSTNLPLSVRTVRSSQPSESPRGEEVVSNDFALSVPRHLPGIGSRLLHRWPRPTRCVLGPCLLLRGVVVSVAPVEG